MRVAEEAARDVRWRDVAGDRAEFAGIMVGESLQVAADQGRLRRRRGSADL